jgi:hypothetical protein
VCAMQGAAITRQMAKAERARRTILAIYAIAPDASLKL